MYKFNAKQTTNNIINWIQDWFSENGSDCKAVIGISGGKDSSIVAALCVEALGKDRVYGVLMPNGVQNDIDVASRLCKFLGIDYGIFDISGAVDSIRRKVKTALDDHWSVQSAINLPARIRMATLYAVSQTVGGRVTNTCNLSEEWVGYSTRWGDSVGDFSPLMNLTVTEVKKIGYVLGLPEEFIEKVPADGLCGKTDEENLGFTYAALDQYIRTGICEDSDVRKKIDDLHEKTGFKRMPIPCFEDAV